MPIFDTLSSLGRSAAIAGVCFAGLTACGGGQPASSPISNSPPSWELADLQINLFESVAISALDRRIVYAAQRNQQVNAEHAIWRSEDGGESFKVVASGVSFQLFPSPTNADLVLGTASEPDSWAGYGINQALYVSRNRGQSWQPTMVNGKGFLLNDFSTRRSLAQHPTQRDTIYAYGRQRDIRAESVFKSVDGGLSWTDVTPSGINFNDYTASFAFDPLHANTLFLSTNFTNADGSAGTLLRSTDGGASWQSADAGLLLRSNEGSMTHVLMQLVATTVPGVLVGVSNFGQLWINSDGGAGTWRPMPLPLGSVDQFFWFASLPNTVLALNRDGTMIRSDDLGSNWKAVTTPAKIYAASADDSVPLGMLITTVGDEALYRSVDAGQTWALQQKPTFSVSPYPVDAYGGRRVTASFTSQDHLLAFQKPRLEVWANGKWQVPRGLDSFRSTVAVTGIAAFGNRLAAIAAGALLQQNSVGGWNMPSGPDSYLGSQGRLSSDGERRGLYAGLFVSFRGIYNSRSLETTDAGTQWTDSAARYPYLGGEAVFDKPNGRFWYLGSFDNRNYSVYLTQGEGPVKSASSGLPAGPLNALANSPQMPARLYVGTPQGLYRSANGGTDWSPAFTGSAGPPAAAIAVDPNDALIVWALGASGLLRSIDGGDHWVALSPAIFAAGAGTLALHRSRSGVAIASSPSGILKSVDAGATWTNIGGPKAGVKQILIVDETINVATDSGLFQCKSLCQAP